MLQHGRSGCLNRLPMVLECQAGNGLQSTPGVDAAEQAVGHPAQAQCAGDAWRLQ